MGARHKLFLYKGKLQRLMKQKEFEERYMDKPQLLTELAFTIDKVRSDILYLESKIKNLDKKLK